MMRTIEIGVGKARLWRDELPQASFRSDETMERELEPSGRGAAIIPGGNVAIEVWQPTGARALYGLLGCRFESHASGRSLIRVPVTGMDGPSFEAAIAASYDAARVGLPKEFGREVVQWLGHEARVAKLGAGVLTVTHAAHTLVGSSRSVFAALAVLAVRMLAERFDESEPDTICEVIRGTMARSAEGNLAEPRPTA